MLDFALAVTIIIALSELIKLQGLATKYIPIVNLILGIVAAFGFMGLGWQDAIVQGILIGLSASGLYDQRKLFKGGE